MGIRTITLPALLLLAAVASASATRADERFMRDAFRDNRIDQNLGRLAARQGRTKAIRAFGQRAVRDHDRAESDLLRTAKRAGLKIPGKADNAKSESYRRLQRLHGAGFDRSYRTAILASHRRDIAEYEREIRETKIAALRDYAKTTLPVLRRHLAEIRRAKL